MAQDPARVRACYDTVAGSYAARFKNELDGKPFDRDRLSAFAAELRDTGRVCDLGCGPGHVTAYLSSEGLDVFGVDLSAGQVSAARALFPSLDFREADMLALDLPSGSLSGIASLYSIVHFTADQLAIAAREMFRVLVPGGRLLLSFHIGADRVSLEEFLDHEVSIDFMFFTVDDVVACLEAAGFAVVEVEQRGPYPDVEAQTTRAYVSAEKPSAD